MSYKITDAKALFEAHPQFFKADDSKIKKAIVIGINLPGVEVSPVVESRRSASTWKVPAPKKPVLAKKSARL